MAYLEELLPEFRNGAKIKRECWSLIKFVHIKNGKIVDEDGNHIDFSDEAFISNDWEFYNGPTIDWEYIVKNKCLCWFSDEDIEEPNFADRLLAVVENESGVKYMTEGKVTFVYCRPVCKDEVTFYEDKRDD